MSDLEGRSYLVTGGASGIGLATAQRLLADGASVVAADVAERPDALDGPDDRLVFASLDVTDESAVADVVSFTVERFGRIDGVVTAAGVAGGGAAHDIPIEEWNRILSVNLTGTFLTVRHVIARMLQQDSVGAQLGSIVTISSIEGLEGTAGGSAYNASKGGVVLLTRNLAIDYGRQGIRANCICPGFIDTPMTQSVFDLDGMAEVKGSLVDAHMLRRFGQPREIAATARFLLDDDASFVTGQAIAVDGGYTAGRDHGVVALLGL